MKRLLIVVDYQNDFVDGSLGFPGAEKLDELIVAKIKSYREAGDEVAFTFDTHHKDYLTTLEGKYLPVEHGIEGSAGWQLYGRVSKMVEDNDHVFVKSAFGSIELAQFLTRRQCAANDRGLQPFISIELVGLVSNICVLSNAVIAKTACPNVPVIVDASCTDSFDKTLHKKCLDVMAGIQIEVINQH